MLSFVQGGINYKKCFIIRVIGPYWKMDIKSFIETTNLIEHTVPYRYTLV